jgi:hypothetical protein
MCLQSSRGGRAGTATTRGSSTASLLTQSTTLRRPWAQATPAGPFRALLARIAARKSDSAQRTLRAAVSHASCAVAPRRRPAITRYAVRVRIFLIALPGRHRSSDLPVRKDDQSDRQCVRDTAAVFGNLKSVGLARKMGLTGGDRRQTPSTPPQIQVTRCGACRRSGQMSLENSNIRFVHTCTTRPTLGLPLHVIRLQQSTPGGCRLPQAGDRRGRGQNMAPIETVAETVQGERRRIHSAAGWDNDCLRHASAAGHTPDESQASPSSAGGGVEQRRASTNEAAYMAEQCKMGIPIAQPTAPCSSSAA